MWFRRRGMWPAWGTARTGAASQRVLDDAELVALRVGHDEVIRHPVLPVLADNGRARPGQTRDCLQHPRPADLLRLAAAAACLHVQVDPVLGRLGLRDLEERDGRPKARRVLDVSAITPFLGWHADAGQPLFPGREPGRWRA